MSIEEDCGQKNHKLLKGKIYELAESIWNIAKIYLKQMLAD